MKKKRLFLTNEKKYTLIIFLSLILLIVLGIILYYDFKTKEQIPLELIQASQPIYKLTGQISAVSASNITVSFTNRILTPTPKKQIKLTFTIDKNTDITTSELPIPFYFRTDTPKIPKLTIRNLEKGQLVDIVSKDDLRTAKSWNLSASKITILNVTNILHGRISSNNKDVLIIKGNPVLAPSAVSYLTRIETKDYTVRITPDTEISFKPPVPPPLDPFSPPSDPKPILYHVHDLVPNTEVSVYVAGNVTTEIPLQAHMIIPYFTNTK